MAALLSAIDQYEKAYGQDPRFRRALVALDDVRDQVQRLDPGEQEESPGSQQAREVGRPGDTPPQKREEAAPLKEQPTSYEEAGEKARERFAQAAG